ncbi:MAG: type IV secretion system DNA-binding domain-containing protein, partial [Pseudomonadota bacterium]
FWGKCQATFSSYRVLGDLTLRYNAIIAFCAIGLISLFGFAIAIRLQTPAAKVVFGPRLLKGGEGERAIRKALFKECKRSGHGIDFTPRVPLSRDRESRHFLIWGSVGSGKTQTMLHLILGAIYRGDGALVIDIKGDMTSDLPGDPILIAPQDARSAVWDIGKDCRTKQDARELAARFIPKSTDPMWSDAARDIFVACVVSLQSERGADWGWRDLYERTTLDAEKLLKLAIQYNPNAIRNLESPESRTTQSILSTFQTHMHVVSTLADAWDADKNDRFSIIEWLHNPTPFRPVILQRDGRYPELSNAWMGGLFSLLSSAVGSPTLAESNTRRIWIFADEFPQLPKMEQFSSLIDLGRSKGVVTVIGAQDMAQLRDTYGRYQGDSWMSMIGTQILTRINLSQAAKDVSAIIGEQEIEKTIKSRTQTPTGSNTTWHKQRERRPVITPSELSTRLGPTKKGIKALVLGVGEDVYELNFPYVSLEQLRPSSVPARWTNASPKPVTNHSFDAKTVDEKERLLSRRDVESILNLDR